jgi:hypothetical protein
VERKSRLAGGTAFKAREKTETYLPSIDERRQEAKGVVELIYTFLLSADFVYF